MKNLLKLLIVILFFTMATESYAQTFRAKAGLNLSNLSVKSDDGVFSDDFKINPTFHLGATAEFSISELFSIETGLLISTKGYRSKDELTIFGEKFEYTTNLNLYYLDVPLNAKVSHDLGGTKIYGIFGPYIGIAVLGTTKTKVKNNDEIETDRDDINLGSDEDDDDFKRLNFGLTAGVGVEINRLQIGLSYDFGLANISAYTDEGVNINTRVLAISVASKLGGK